MIEKRTSYPGKDLGKESLQIQKQAFQLVKYPWVLCNDAEKFLLDDIESGNVSIVNDTFLMKGTGMSVGVALVERSADGGIIKPGFWYEPRSHELRENIRTKVIEGEKSIDIQAKTVWVETRKVRDPELYIFNGKTTIRRTIMGMVNEAADRIR